RPKMNNESSGSAHVASTGNGSLVTFTRVFYGDPIQPTPSAAVLIDADLTPRTAEMPLNPDTTIDTAVASNGSEYVVVADDMEKVSAWRFSRDGVMQGAGRVVIADLGYGNTPLAPAVAATGSGWAVGWRAGVWTNRPRQDGYLALLNGDLA